MIKCTILAMVYFASPTIKREKLENSERVTGIVGM